jgi:hypothetical protein
MNTRKKLLLSALGFVAATTALALWQQAAPPKIEQVAHRIPALENCAQEIHWLSSDELLFEREGTTHHSPPEHAQILNLKTGQLRSLPVPPNLRSYGFTLTREQPYRENPLPSPDGKWLLYEEGVYAEGPNRRTGWLLVRSDGSEQRKLSVPITEKERYTRKTFWLPDSSGWYLMVGSSADYANDENWLEKYDFSGKRVSSRRIDWKPERILADGRLSYKGFLDAILLCNPDSFGACEELPDRYEHPVNSSINDETLSYDAKSRFVIFTVTNKPIPEQDFWEALFHRHFPRAHREFWLISREGKQSRCLATDDVSNIPDGDHSWEVLSWSPDGKRVLLSRQRGLLGAHEVYAIDL